MSNKTAFIAIVGRPNVGKSSLLNRMVGRKIAITSNKPQTTRTRIMGVLTRGETQLVFVDTPGMHRPRTKLGEHMVSAVYSGMADVDLALMVVESQPAPGPAERSLLLRLRQDGMPTILAINKIDLVKDKKELLPCIQAYADAFEFDAVVPVSARNGRGVDALLAELEARAVESPRFFDDDALTDQPEQTLAAEMVREGLLRVLEKEVPHGIAVAVEKFAPRADAPDLLDVEANIYCERESHKGIVIGKDGETLKRAAAHARRGMEEFFGCRVNLQCWVKVKEDWRNREGLLHGFGLDS